MNIPVLGRITLGGVIVGVILGIVLAPQISRIPGVNRIPVELNGC